MGGCGKNVQQHSSNKARRKIQQVYVLKGKQFGCSSSSKVMCLLTGRAWTAGRCDSRDPALSAGPSPPQGMLQTASLGCACLSRCRALLLGSAPPQASSCQPFLASESQTWATTRSRGLPSDSGDGKRRLSAFKHNARRSGPECEVFDSSRGEDPASLMSSSPSDPAGGKIGGTSQNFRRMLHLDEDPHLLS